MEKSGFQEWIRTKPEGVRQFVKFAIVGGTSTVLDLASNYVLWHFFRFIPYAMADWCLSVLTPLAIAPDEQKLAAAMTSVISSGIIGTANAFYWNRRWTFRATEPGTAGSQMKKFFVVAYSGMALRAGLVYALVPHKEGLSAREMLPYNLIAIFIVMFWNFFMNRFWTFKKKAGDVI